MCANYIFVLGVIFFFLRTPHPPQQLPHQSSVWYKYDFVNKSRFAGAMFLKFFMSCHVVVTMKYLVPLLMYKFLLLQKRTKANKIHEMRTIFCGISETGVLVERCEMILLLCTRRNKAYWIMEINATDKNNNSMKYCNRSTITTLLYSWANSSSLFLD